MLPCGNSIYLPLGKFDIIYCVNCDIQKIRDYLYDKEEKYAAPFPTEAFGYRIICTEALTNDGVVA